RCGTRFLIGILLIATVVLNMHQFLTVGWTQLTWYSAAGIIALWLSCLVSSRLRKCGVDSKSDQTDSGERE
ncbi:MAG TPA: hypothetical protein PKH07_18045, partial [bacterium]|nr:hypothetical protein [bacterium]